LRFKYVKICSPSAILDLTEIEFSQSAASADLHRIHLLHFLSKIQQFAAELLTIEQIFPPGLGAVLSGQFSQLDRSTYTGFGELSSPS